MPMLMFVLMVAVIIAGVLISAVAWRYANDARRRDVARAALLRHAATTENWDDCIEHREPTAHLEPAAQSEPSAAVPVESLFAAGTRPRATSSHSWIAVAAAVVVIALVAATVAARRIDAPEATETTESKKAVTSPTAKTGSAPAGITPISLKALTHAHGRSGDLTVTGTIQNPAGGTPLDHLIAVVDAFDSADQIVVATVTSGVDASMLLSGDTTRFVVAIPRADSVARYRVRFRLRVRLGHPASR